MNVEIHGQVRLWAHRGASSIAPENTIAAFNKAVEVWAYGLEMDLHLTADDSIIVIHDFTVDRITNGKGEVNKLKYEYIKNLDAGSKFNQNFKGEKIPSFTEILENFPDVPLMLEIKGDSPSLPRKIFDELQKYNRFSDIWIQAFNSAKLDTIKKLSKEIKTLYLVNTLSEIEINKTKQNGYDAIGASKDITKNLIDYAKFRNISIIPWTVNNAFLILEFFNYGINDIITDYPQYSKNLNGNYEVKSNLNQVSNILVYNLNGLIQFILNNFNNGIYKIGIYNILGQRITSDEIEIINKIQNYYFKTGGLAAGIYFFTFNERNKLLAKKFKIMH